MHESFIDSDREKQQHMGIERVWLICKASAFGLHVDPLGDRG